MLIDAKDGGVIAESVDTVAASSVSATFWLAVAADTRLLGNFGKFSVVPEGLDRFEAKEELSRRCRFHAFAVPLDWILFVSNSSRLNLMRVMASKSPRLPFCPRMPTIV